MWTFLFVLYIENQQYKNATTRRCGHKEDKVVISMCLKDP